MAGQKCDHRLKNKKYTIPLPYSRDVGWLKDILRWPSQQKKQKQFFIICSPHPPRTSWARRSKPCFRPSYFQLQLSNCMMETCKLLAGVRVHEHW